MFENPGNWGEGAPSGSVSISCQIMSPVFNFSVRVQVSFLYSLSLSLDTLSGLSCFGKSSQTDLCSQRHPLLSYLCAFLLLNLSPGFPLLHIRDSSYSHFFKTYFRFQMFGDHFCFPPNLRSICSLPSTRSSTGSMCSAYSTLLPYLEKILT